VAWHQVSFFGIGFSYPDPTPDGHAIERNEQDRGDMQRVHVRSPESGEVYFEAARFVGLSPRDEYARHRPYLEQRFGEGAVTELTEGRYGFRWDDGERTVVLLGVGDDTYRFIYDPRSAVNDEILATVRPRVTRREPP
jgi:hypothetical protein